MERPTAPVNRRPSTCALPFFPRRPKLLPVMTAPASIDSSPVATIGAPGLDAAALVAQIQADVDRKIADGVYSDARVARAEKTNLGHLRDSDDFLSFYLTCLRDAVYVDISDFEIREQRRYLAAPLVLLKKVIWKLLKFYTYRLWSQQNQINGIVITAVESIEQQFSARIADLEKRVAALESRNRD